MDYQSMFTFMLEMAGTIAFAASGAMVGAQRGMDIFGVCVLGVVTAVGGGATRDIILGIVPGIIVTQLMIHYYENQAVEVSVSAVRTECAILCDQIIKENYLNDSSSEAVNSKLELLSNVYGGRILVSFQKDFFTKIGRASCRERV